MFYQTDFNNNNINTSYSTIEYDDFQRPSSSDDLLIQNSIRFDECQYALPYGTPKFNLYQDLFYYNLGYQYKNVIDITRIDTIENQMLQFLYDRKKEDLYSNGNVVEEKICYHTGAMTLSERNRIARYNFKPSYKLQNQEVNNRPGTIFTRNVRDSLHKTKHIVYVVKLLQSKLYLHSGLQIPSNVDTVYDLSGKYIMKFNEDEYYPLAVIYYNINEHDF